MSYEFEFILNHVVTCLRKAESNQSELTHEILTYKGMSGFKTRHFYNNICSLPGCRYLEIGTYHGSSSISALYKNQVDAVFIDNWSLFDGNKSIFDEAIEKYNTGSKIEVIDNDCWKVDTTTATFEKKFNVYLYDGGHEYQDHYKAISQFHNTLEENCIVLIDDWNWEDVRKGTLDAIKDLGLKVKFKHEILTPQPHYILGVDNWWNGIGIFII